MNLIECPYCHYDKNEAQASTNQTFTNQCGKCYAYFKYKLIIKLYGD
jgi:hypothetical protein